MNNNQDQQQTGGVHEDLSREGHNSIRDGVHVDGYSGPRARMVFFSPDTGSNKPVTADEDDSRLGPFERIVVFFLGLLTMSAILVSILVLPISITAYLLYAAMMKAFRLFFPKKQRGRFVILGTNGSYMIKDIVTREFVAKNIPKERSARKILRIFESEYTNVEEQ